MNVTEELRQLPHNLFETKSTFLLSWLLRKPSDIFLNSGINLQSQPGDICIVHCLVFFDNLANLVHNRILRHSKLAAVKPSDKVECFDSFL